MAAKPAILQYSFYTHQVYDVNFNGDHIKTIVSNSGSIVHDWIEEIERSHRHRLHKLIVGLEVKWRPAADQNNRNPVVILQLCVGRRCLIFQLLHGDQIPKSFVGFLYDEEYTFVGVGIQDNVDKLLRDYNLEVYNIIDLRYRAAMELGRRELINSGLKRLAREVLGIEIKKLRSVSMSRWDSEWLSDTQVEYACLDAFISFEIGRILMSKT